MKVNQERIEWNIEAEPQYCPFGCGRAYTSMIGMKSHLKRFHLQEQENNHDWNLPDLRFRCPYCPYHSNRRSNLERHLNRYHIDDVTTNQIGKKRSRNKTKKVEKN